MTVNKLVMSAVENNSSFRTATKKHENHSEAIDLTVNRGSLKETEEKEKKKEKKTIRFCF